MPYLYLDICSNLRYLKLFLALREQEIFADIKAAGRIGLPCIQREDGSLTFTWEEFLVQ